MAIDRVENDFITYQYARNLHDAGRGDEEALMPCHGILYCLARFLIGEARWPWRHAMAALHKMAISTYDFADWRRRGNMATASNHGHHRLRQWHEYFYHNNAHTWRFIFLHWQVSLTNCGFILLIYSIMPAEILWKHYSFSIKRVLAYFIN